MSRARSGAAAKLQAVPDPLPVDPVAAPEVFDPTEDARVTYELAESRARALRKQWEDMDMPILTTGSMGQTVPHPLVKMVETAEAHAAKLREAMQKRKPGASPKGVVTASIGKSPAQLKRQGGK